ncbi:MAG TPA: hypothetical protein VFX21_10825, partial [Acidimicrobiia bacterium]|nr:hypothetical protein [Acidimicrobiia bacterium]
VGLLVLLVAGLLRSHAEILRALHQLGVNLDPGASEVVAPSATAIRSVPVTGGPPKSGRDVTGATPTGDAVSIAVRDVRHLTLLAFLSSGCATCLDFWSAFGTEPAPEVPGDARLVIVTKGSAHESLSGVHRLAPSRIPVVMSSEAWDEYDVPVAPFFVLVDGVSGAIVGEGAASNWGQVTSLMEQAVTDARITKRGRRSHAPGRPRSDALREARVDHDLLAAGIVPGDARLYRLPEAESVPVHLDESVDDSPHERAWPD